MLTGVVRAPTLELISTFSAFPSLSCIGRSSLAGFWTLAAVGHRSHGIWSPSRSQWTWVSWDANQMATRLWVMIYLQLFQFSLWYDAKYTFKDLRFRHLVYMLQELGSVSTRVKIEAIILDLSWLGTRQGRLTGGAHLIIWEVSVWGLIPWGWWVGRWPLSAAWSASCSACNFLMGNPWRPEAMPRYDTIT